MIQFLGLPTTWGYPKTEVLEGPKISGKWKWKDDFFFRSFFLDVDFFFDFFFFGRKQCCCSVVCCMLLEISHVPFSLTWTGCASIYSDVNQKTETKPETTFSFIDISYH